MRVASLGRQQVGVGSDYSRLADALGDCKEGVSGVELETVQGDGCCVAVHGVRNARHGFTASEGEKKWEAMTNKAGDRRRTLSVCNNNIRGSSSWMYRP